MIANVLDSIACAQVELNDLTKAFEALDEAIRIHHANNPLHMARTNFILSMAYLRAGKPDNALEALDYSAGQYAELSKDILPQCEWCQPEETVLDDTCPVYS